MVMNCASLQLLYR